MSNTYNLFERKITDEITRMNYMHSVSNITGNSKLHDS
jgi:hypothetical protein